MTKVEETGSELLVFGPTDRVAVFGPMGSGKSVVCRHLFRQYPLDRVLIDVNGDVDPANEFTRPAPQPLPPIGAKISEGRYEDNWWEADRPLSLRWVPDYTEKDWREQVDHLVGLCFAHRNTLLWFDEVGELIPVGKTLPWTAAALHLGRHPKIPQLYAGPRFKGVDLLVKQQSKLLIFMGMMDGEDLEPIAKTLRISVDELVELLTSLEPHGFIAWERQSGIIHRCGPIENPL